MPVWVSNLHVANLRLEGPAGSARAGGCEDGPVAWTLPTSPETPPFPVNANGGLRRDR
jgi:hypothetical protein